MDANKLKFKKWGVLDWGYTEEATPRSLIHYNQWVEQKNHLPLTYLEGERQGIRQSLLHYWPEFKSAMVFLFSYKETHEEMKSFYHSDAESNGLKVASYTLGFDGLDYHLELKKRLEEIAENILNDDSELRFKIVLDTHPVLERDLAFRAGLGWFGKNSMLIHKEHGSLFIIGTLLFNKTLPQFNQTKALETDHCGHCTRCSDACPTEAIDPKTRTLKAHDCISTFTIEQFKPDTIPSPKMNLDSGYIFGCDICQDVCPWNKKEQLIDLLQTGITDRKQKLIEFFLKTPLDQLYKLIFMMSEGAFRREMGQTSFERSGRRGVLKNILFKLK